jgi:hypothetical protein
MKLKFFLILAVVTFCLTQNGIAQKALSQGTIKEFARACEFQAQYNQNQNFLLVTLINHISDKAGSTDKAYTKMINTEIDREAREDVFEAFHSISGGDADKLYTYLFNWGVSAAHAKEISGYINRKYNSSKEGQNKAVNSLFTGTKRFTDGEAWDYVVTINKGNITLKLYPSVKNSYYKDKTKAKAVVTGKIKDGKIITTSDREYKYENNNLYEMNNEGGWNEYNEIAAKK